MIREETAPAVRTTTFVTLSPVTLSATAAAKLSEVMAQKGMTDAALRVFVSGGGCSGLQYGMAFDNEMDEADQVFESEGVKVVVDPVSLPYLQGATIDFTDSLMGGGFKIENPNAVSSCGCGTSFKTSDQASSGAEGEAKAQGGGCGSHGGGGGGCGCG
ncbi:MAG: iron-sulfur cluster insertion protein ErpA [Ardenticatenales bacterium]|nr:iron-sulfur cluster insertion protein ErpA [Ardenticatenales bacterium]